MTKSDGEDQWFEVADRDWLPESRSKQLRLLADAQVPAPVIAEISGAGISIQAIPLAGRSHSDTRVLQRAQGAGRVLLTLDADFWDDRRFPVHQVERGIIYVAEPPDQHDRVLRAFGLVYGCFAKSYPLDWWRHTKVRAVVGEFELKMRTWEGKVAHYKMKLSRGTVVAKEA